MIKKMLATAAFAGLAPLSAHAALTMLTAADGWPPAGSSGLETVQFAAVAASGVKVAIGAHAYKNSAFLANDGVRNFQAQGGVYLPDGKNYANWSFDFAYDIRGCQGCKIWLGIDTDSSAAVSYTDIDLLTAGLPTFLGESWNLEMSFLTTPGFNFNPYAASSTDFRLFVTDAAGATLATTDITVNVPEPASMALVGIALAGLAAGRRRRT
ncbi:PEP-CTERM sorting domain-containing protein [Roseateles sp. P5_D6]